MYGVSFPMTKEEMSEDFLIPIGKAKIEKEGTDVTVVAHSKMVTHALEAAEQLEKEQGIKAEVVNLRYVHNPNPCHRFVSHRSSLEQVANSLTNRADPFDRLISRPSSSPSRRPTTSSL